MNVWITRMFVRSFVRFSCFVFNLFISLMRGEDCAVAKRIYMMHDALQLTSTTPQHFMKCVPFHSSHTPRRFDVSFLAL